MFKNILVAVDGTAISRRAARFAIRLARSNRARLTAFHVIPVFRSVAGYFDMYIPDASLYSPKEYERLTEKETRRMLAPIAKQAAAEKVRCATAWVYDDSPWKAIIAEAKRRRCDLIVMASHGRRGLEAVILGSEAAKVLTHSKIPVLVTR